MEDITVNFNEIHCNDVLWNELTHSMVFFLLLSNLQDVTAKS